ncbi:MAG: hypothetical protein R6V39_04185 [Desulfovibrionales bacterium]
MKHIFPILVMLVVLVALPATAAWSQSNDSTKCMENCLEPAIESGDEDVIHEAITHCLAQCNPPEPLGHSKLGSTNSGMSTSFKNECLQICFRKDDQCQEEWGRAAPEKCSKKLKKCWDACLQ